MNSISFSNNKGNSEKDAIKIIGAPSEKEGVDAEYEYIGSIYGKENIDWRLVQQCCLIIDDQKIDIIEIKLRNGEQFEYCFDISEFYGK